LPHFSGEARIETSDDYKMAETYHKGDITKFLESIGKKVDAPSLPEYIQSNS
jgi:hypothetical protein